MVTQARPAIRDDVSEASTPALLGSLINDARELAVGHLERMQGEIGDEFRNLKQAMLKIAIAVGVVIVGAVLVGEALAMGLVALGLVGWAAYGIAAILAIGTGIVLLKRMPGNKEEMDLIPEDAIASLKRDVSSVQRAATHS